MDLSQLKIIVSHNSKYKNFDFNLFKKKINNFDCVYINEKITNDILLLISIDLLIFITNCNNINNIC